MARTTEFTPIAEEQDVTAANLASFTFILSKDGAKDYEIALSQLQGLEGWNGGGVVSGDVQLADLASTEEDSGAELIGFYNNDARLGGATTLQEVGDRVHTNYLDKDAAEDPEEIFSLPANSRVLVALEAGGYAWIDVTQLPALSGGVIETNETNLDLTTDHVNKTIYFTSSSACTATIPLQSAQEFGPDDVIRLVQEGAGALTVVCDDATIVINGAADGVAASPGRYGMITLRNKTSDVWLSTAPAVATTADTTAPTLVSVNPANGSTIQPSQPIEFIFDEAIAPGTGNFIERVDTGGGFSNGTVVDITDPLGTGAGEVNIIGNKLTFYPAAPRTAEADIAYKMAAGVITDTADTPNSFAGLLDDVTVAYTVAAAEESEIAVVASGTWIVNAGGGTDTRTMSVTPSAGDMVVLMMGSGKNTYTGTPAGFTAIMDKTTPSTGAPSYLGYRIEGVTPSADIAVPRCTDRKVIAGWMIVRGTGGTLSVSGFPAPAGSTAFTTPPNAPAYTQPTADELRVIFGACKNHDITPGAVALVADGWDPQINANTGQGSTSGGATIVAATYPQGGSINDSIDPDPWESAGMNWWAIHFGIKETA